MSRRRRLQFKAIEFVMPTSSLVIEFSLHRFTAGCEAFAVKPAPGSCVLGRFHLTGIVAIETVKEIFTRANIAATGFLTPQNVTVKHSDRNTLGATGFEPATSWSQTTRSTKLSYAPFCETMLTITNATSHPENCRSQRREIGRAHV